MTALKHESHMRLALALARESAAEGEVPVGCVVVSDGVVVGTGRNRRERDKRAAAHAELEAIDAANRALGGWRLWRASLYVTLEPCPMCAGAIMNARIPFVYFGAPDPKAGAMGSVFNLFDFPVNHKPAVSGGLLGDECAALLKEFFRDLRNRRTGNEGYDAPAL